MLVHESYDHVWTPDPEDKRLFHCKCGAVRLEYDQAAERALRETYIKNSQSRF